MPSHHRIKNISYDDDDYYSEEEEDDYDEPQPTTPSTSPSTALNPDNPSNGLSDSDRASLRTGCLEVKQLLSALDGDVQVADAEVWEALWEFYYDVDESVRWLQEKVKERKKKERKEREKKSVKEKEKAKGQPQAQAQVKAQVKGFGAKHSGAKDVTSSMKQMNIKDTHTQLPQHQQGLPQPAPAPVKIKHKGLDVPREYLSARDAGRRKLNAANFVVIGHVDAGKSTLMGRLLLDLKTVTARQLAKHRAESSRIGKNSFALAWFLDSSAEEREHGVTIDVASTHFATANTVYTLLDAPGHKDFVPNMISGAALADFAILVIDAGVGGFEKGLKGQTKEHALLVRSLGVRKVVVAVNKMDASGGGGQANRKGKDNGKGGEWSRDRYEEIEMQTRAFLTSTVGFADKNVVFVPCSGWRGQNVVARRSPSQEAEQEADSADSDSGVPEWYTGPTLLDILEQTSAELSALRNVEASMQKDLRMTIVDVFRGGVTNPLSISGRIDTGHVQVGDSVCAMPTGAKAVVKGIDVEGILANEPDEEEEGDDINESTGDSADWAVAGDNVVLHLANLESPSTSAHAKDFDATAQLRAGDILCPPARPVRNVVEFTAKVLTFAHLTPMHVAVHRGRLNVPASITSLVAVLDKSNNEVVKRRPKIVAPGCLARVKVRCEVEVPLEKGGRVVLRAEGDTVAAGLIE